MIEITTALVSIRATETDYAVSDETNRGNQTVIACRAGKRTRRKVYNWLLKNREQLATMTFEQIHHEIFSIDNRAHYYLPD